MFEKWSKQIGAPPTRNYKTGSKGGGFPIQKHSLAVSPRITQYSTQWTKGKVHQDFDDVNCKCVYSIMLFLDEVNIDNGAIEFWPKSKAVPVDKKHPAVQKAG
jgi:hypothetical protein